MQVPFDSNRVSGIPFRLLFFLTVFKFAVHEHAKLEISFNFRLLVPVPVGLPYWLPCLDRSCHGRKYPATYYIF